MAESDFQIGSITSVPGNSLCCVSGSNNGAVDLLHGLKIDLLFIERTESEAGWWCGRSRKS